MAKYKICKVCGNKFKTCSVCEGSNAPSWKKYSDSFEHFDIYTTIILYTRGQLSKEESAERMKDYPHTGYMPEIQKFIDKIYFTDEAKPTEEVEPLTNEVITETKAEEVEETVAPKKRRNKKQESDVLG